MLKDLRGGGSERLVPAVNTEIVPGRETLAFDRGREEGRKCSRVHRSEMVPGSAQSGRCHRDTNKRGGGKSCVTGKVAQSLGGVPGSQGIQWSLAVRCSLRGGCHRQCPERGKLEVRRWFPENFQHEQKREVSGKLSSHRGRDGKKCSGGGVNTYADSPWFVPQCS